MKTTLTITIDFDQLDIDAYYCKAEKQTLEHDGCPAGFEINHVKYKGFDLGRDLQLEDWENINQWLLNEMSNKYYPI